MSVSSNARDVLKRGFREAAVLTAALRPPPDFMIIGTKRGGTTSLYFDLLEHPQTIRLSPPPVPGLKIDPTKGVHFFDSNYFRGDRWYGSHMPTSTARALRSRLAGGRVVAGEASPYYLFHPDAARRAHVAVPDVRVIALLRDPVMRTYSHWKERRREHAEELSFVDALSAEPDRLAGERERLVADSHYVSYAWEQQSYFTQSLYADALRPWIELFGRDRVLVAASEDYYDRPDDVLASMHEFLGISVDSSAPHQHRNAAQGSELPADVHSMLAERFREPNAQLSALTGQAFPWA